MSWFWKHYSFICPNVTQFLQTTLQSNVPHTTEQHANIHGTSSSGGTEQEQTAHIK